MNHNSMHRVILIAMLAMAFPAASFAGFGVGIGINVGFAPPPLPIYAQPPCPAPGYIWTPGYWGYAGDDEDYYWVPGTWVMAPSEGLLWTPGYWGEVGGGYALNEGYWGPQVGFYGGINYGFGYFGEGFAGGYWQGDDFFYNRSVTNVSNVNITNVYNRTINNNSYGSRASFNGVHGVADASRFRADAAHVAHLDQSWTPADRGHPAAGFVPGQRHSGRDRRARLQGAGARQSRAEFSDGRAFVRLGPAWVAGATGRAGTERLSGTAQLSDVPGFAQEQPLEQTMGQPGLDKELVIQGMRPREGY